MLRKSQNSDTHVNLGEVVECGRRCYRQLSSTRRVGNEALAISEPWREVGNITSTLDIKLLQLHCFASNSLRSASLILTTCFYVCAKNMSHNYLPASHWNLASDESRRIGPPMHHAISLPASYHLSPCIPRTVLFHSYEETEGDTRHNQAKHQAYRQMTLFDYVPTLSTRGSRTEVLLR
jgi:hypothetical protein